MRVVLDLSVRDRLLLAFADLNSYGILARGPVPGQAAAIRKAMNQELASAYPNGTRSFAFWTDRADSAFDEQGNLPLGASLTVNVSSARDTEAVCKILGTVGIRFFRSGRASVAVIGKEPAK